MIIMSILMMIRTGAMELMHIILSMAIRCITVQVFLFRLVIMSHKQSNIRQEHNLVNDILEAITTLGLKDMATTILVMRKMKMIITILVMEKFMGTTIMIITKLIYRMNIRMLTLCHIKHSSIMSILVRKLIRKLLFSHLWQLKLNLNLQQ